MRHILILPLLIALPCWSQTTKTGEATTKGPCSPAVTGNTNQFTINCPQIDQQQGQKMLAILNKILAKQLDPDAVMTKLDEISSGIQDIQRRTNPNTRAKIYNCAGAWKEVGPSENATLYIGAPHTEKVEIAN